MVKTLSLKELISNGFNAFFKDWKTYGLLVLFFMTLPFALLYMQNQVLSVGILIAVLLIIVSSAALQLAIIFIGNNTLKKKKTTVQQLHKVLREKYWKFLLTDIMSGLTVLATLIPFLLLMALFSGLLGESTLSIALSFTFIILGVLAMAAMSILLYFTKIIVVLDKVAYAAALKKSYTLLKKSFWKNVLYIVALQIITLLLILVTDGVFGYILPLESSLGILILSLIQLYVIAPVLITAVNWYQHYK